MKRLVAFPCVLALVAAVSQLDVKWPGPFVPVAGTVTLGNQSTGTTFSLGTQGAAIVPIIMPNASSGCTLNTFYVNVSTAYPINMGIYSFASSANCPSGAFACAASLQSAYSDVTPSTGLNAYPASDFTNPSTSYAANTYNALVVASYNTSVTLNAENGSFCPGTGFWQLASSIGGSSLPSTMGSQSEPSSFDCSTIYATFNCTGGVTVPAPWAVFTWAGNSSGSQVTTSNVLTGACGYNGSIGGTLTSATVYDNSETRSLPTAGVCNGSNYSGGTLSIERGASDTDYFQYSGGTGEGGSTQDAWLMWVYNSGNTEASGAQFDLAAADAGLGSANSLYPGAYGPGTHSCPSGGNQCIEVECGGGSGGTTYWGDVPFSQSTWYAIVVNQQATATHEVAVYNTSGSELTSGSNTCADGKTICITNTGTGSGWAAQNPWGFKLPDAGSASSAGGTWWYGPVLFDPTGNSWSTLGSTYGELFPDSPKSIGAYLSALVERGAIHRAEFKNGKWHSYALSVGLVDAERLKFTMLPHPVL